MKRKGSYLYNDFRKIEVGISLLPFLHLGTFWSNRIHQTTALTERVKFWSLAIGEESARIVDAKSFKALNSLLFYYPSIERCLDTNFFEIDIPQEPKKKILIPSYEIIRFYFAGSSHLTRNIIMGGVRRQPNQLFDPANTKIDRETGIAELILRSKLAKSDRHQVARIAFSEVAEKSTWGIYSSVAKNLNNQNRGIVEAKLPFVGKTDLQVCGKWFPQNEIWHFLVYFIESCSHPFPYKQLKWGIEGDYKENTGTGGGEKNHFIKQIKPPNTDEIEVGSEDEPSLREIFEEANYDGQYFTDLENKEPEERLRGEKTEAGIRYGVVKKDRKDRDEISTGEGTFGNSEIGGLKIKISDKGDENEDKEKNKRLPAGWELFTDILKALEEDKSLKTKIISFDIYDSEIICLETEGIYFPYPVNRRSNWAYIDKTQLRRRQVMLAEIMKDNKFYYLFDIEVDTENKNDHYSLLVIKGKNSEKLENSFWRKLIKDCGENRGVRRDLWIWMGGIHFPIRHDFKKISKFTDRIKEVLI